MFNYELGRLIFDKKKNINFNYFNFDDNISVKVPLNIIAPEYKKPCNFQCDRYYDYTIKEFIIPKKNLEIGDIVKLDKEKINTNYFSVFVDGIVYTKTTQFELDAFLYKFYPNSDNAKVYKFLKDFREEKDKYI